MPLKHGITSALNSINLPFPQELLALIIQEQESVFRFLRSCPECIEAPYPYKYKEETVTLPVKLMGNQAFEFARSLGLQEFGWFAQSVFEESWNQLRSTVREKSALQPKLIRELCMVDLLIGIASVLNDYVSHKGRIANIYHTSAFTDALGRTIQVKAEEAVQRLLAKEHGVSMGNRMWSVQHQTARVLQILVADEYALAKASANSGIAFEREIATMLRDAGLTAHETAASGDFGADLMVEADGLRIVIQCKDHARPIGVKAVQEAAAARTHYVADFAVVCSRSEFTDAALELANSAKVLLCLSHNLVRRLQTI